MKKIVSIFAAALCVFGAKAQDPKATVEVHGFIRNYCAVDSRRMIGLTEDFFTYVPYDKQYVDGVDVNSYFNSRFAALTSRLWVEAKGYEVEGWKVGARIEADFYNGLGNDKVTGTANLRLRQAFFTLSKNAWSFKFGQAWHPMAADMPDIFSLNTGAPFGPFSRTPQFSGEVKFSDAFSLNAAAIWQMQYTSTGPDGKSASYIKYGNTPEMYLGVNLKTGGLLLRAGVDVLSIKPRVFGVNADNKTVKVKDRITTVTPFFFLKYATDNFSVKFKTVFAEAGEHVNLNGGYGLSKINDDGSWEYTPSRNSSSWLSICVGKKVQGILFAGYVKNFGTKKALLDPNEFWFSGNSFKNMNQMARVTPTVIYNLGKVALGLEYEGTAVQYGKDLNVEKGLYDKGLHWVVNHRVQALLKYTF